MIKEGILSTTHVPIIAVLFFLLVILLTEFFSEGDLLLWALVSVGLFCAVSYSVPPLKLCYRPFLGEWFGLFPTVVAMVIGFSYLACGAVTAYALAAGTLQGLFSIAWLV